MDTISYEEYVAFVQFALSDGYFWLEGGYKYSPKYAKRLGNGCYHYKPVINNCA